MIFEIWAEGYRVTGGDAPATLMGIANGENFIDAVSAFAGASPEFARHLDMERLTYWGCRLFATETEARRFNG